MKSFKKDLLFLALAIVLLLVGVLTSVISGGQNEDRDVKGPITERPLKIGAIIPFSASAQSEALMAGIEIAREDIAEEASAEGVFGAEVILRDSELDPQKGEALARELIEDGVDAIYSSHTVVTREVTGPAGEAGVALFYDSCNCGFAEENPLAFQMYFDPRKECRDIAEEFHSQGVRRAGFIGQDVPYGEFCYGEVQEVFGEENVELELEDDGPQLTNYGFLLKRWKENGVGVVLSIPAVKSFPFLFERNYSRGINLPIACFEGVCLTKDIRENTPAEALENVIGFGFEITPEFEEKLLSENPEYEREDVVAAAVSHDAIIHAWQLVSQCGNDSDCIRRESRRLDYPTAVVSSGFDDTNILIYESSK